MVVWWTCPWLLSYIPCLLLDAFDFRKINKLLMIWFQESPGWMSKIFILCVFFFNPFHQQKGPQQFRSQQGPRQEQKAGRGHHPDGHRQAHRRLQRSRPGEFDERVSHPDCQEEQKGHVATGDWWTLLKMVIQVSWSKLFFEIGIILFPECVARVPVSLGGLGVRLCSPSFAFAVATVGNRPQPFAVPP